MQTQVLIIGAGPVGMTLAAELARYGVALRIVDRAAARTDKSKAVVIWSRTLELLERGIGARPFVAAGVQAKAATIVAGGKLVARVGFEQVHSAYPYALMLPQSETERLLEERLATLGVRVEREIEATGIERRPDGVATLLRDAQGRVETLRTDWLVGCDGARSLVRHAIGAEFPGETLQSDWMLADLHLQGHPYPDDIAIFWHRDGVFLIFPIAPGRFRVIADQPGSGTAHPAVPSLARVQAVIAERGPKGMVGYDPIWLSSFRINDRKVADYRAGRIFLAGDAAHIHSPAGGQGMNTGMQDAFNLAWKLALVVQGRCDEALLESYSAERSAVGDRVLQAAGRMTAVATAKNPVVQRLRNLVGHTLLGLAPLRRAMANQMSETSLGYRTSPLNGPGLRSRLGPKPGERVVPRAGETPFGVGSRPRFALLAAPSAATAALMDRHAALLEPALRQPFAPDGLWLVRPDGYAACSSRDAAVIAAYLDGLVRRGGA